MATLKPPKDLTTPELVAFLNKLNEAYRTGEPLVDDDTYDHVYLAELKTREPEHPFLTHVEPEPLSDGAQKIRHKVPMLSTDKAYDQDEINAFIRRVIKHAESIGMAETDIQFRITPKLDGMAAKYEDDRLVTRGNGLVGNDITHNIKRGVIVKGKKNCGVGEIVIPDQYFNENLSDHFSHPRNFVTGLIGSDKLSELAIEALQDGAVQFVSYETLDNILCNVERLSSEVEPLCEQLEKACAYPLDGCVIDVMNHELREDLGSTNHHNNWQIAKKRKGETATAKVTGITWQTGRTGRITPVINIETTSLSGANITNITGHHAGNIKHLNVGVGSTIEFVRSGEVIPKLLGVIETGNTAELPDCCPACGYKTEWDNDFLVCNNLNCIAQVESQLIHFFATLGNIDLFGPRTIAKLVENSYSTLDSIYALKADDFKEMGFGDKQSTNLEAQLLRSRTESVENWRFLAAFGIEHLGKGDAKKLLEQFSIEQLNELTPEDIIQVSGFGDITSHAIADGIQAKWDTIASLLDLNFNLLIESKETVSDSPISGEFIVFTGSMNQSRDGMKKQAQSLGATVQSSVNKKTTLLVIGEKVGATKIEKAEKLGTRVLTEAEYTSLIT